MDSDETFYEEELIFINLIAKFVDTFDTASEISDFSHNLAAWKETKSGEIIDYPKYAEEIVKAVDRRTAT